MQVIRGTFGKLPFMNNFLQIKFFSDAQTMNSFGSKICSSGLDAKEGKFSSTNQKTTYQQMIKKYVKFVLLYVGCLKIDIIVEISVNLF